MEEEARVDNDDQFSLDGQSMNYCSFSETLGLVHMIHDNFFPDSLILIV